MTSLSRRGLVAVEAGLSEYYRVQAERQGQPGYVGLSVAEDVQVRELVRERLDRVPPLPDHTLGYDAFGGKAVLREAVAELVGRHLLGRPVDPSHVTVLSGAGAVLEALAFAIGDPGDVVLVPTPSYAGFWPDLEHRAGLRIQPVHTRPEHGYTLTPDLLETAAAAAPGPVRALLLTTPDNPRGEVVPLEALDACLTWAERHDLHVIADEVYALAVHGGEPHTSIGALRPSLGEGIHLVWGVSKDLAASGLRVGFLISEHTEVSANVEIQACWSGVSSLAQHAVADLLADQEWLAGYLPVMRTRLAESADVVRAALDGADIPRTAGDAGFFLLADLRRFLDAPTWEAEHRLWRRILDDTGVNITPGAALRAVEPGLFRICHAGEPLDVVTDAITRVTTLLARG